MSGGDENGEGDAGRRASFLPPWHFLQSELWAKQKERFGWTAVFVPHDATSVDEVGARAAPILTLSRVLPAGVVLTYVPYAPADAAGVTTGVPGPEPEALSRTLEALVPRIAEEVTRELGRAPTVVRFDLPQESGGRGAPAESERRDLPAGGRAEGAPGPPAQGLRAAPVAVQPPDTVVVDLAREEDEILAAMHKKNRYNVRLAERKGVTVRAVDPAAPGGAETAQTALRSWYEIYRETARRDGITIHAAEYYEHLFGLVRPGADPRLRLYLAEHEGDLLAGIVVVFHGRGATYLYGASSNEKRNLMPNYALQWRAMSDAKAEGCSWYDLFGVPPADDPNHPLHGLYRFKTGFGGALVRRLGAWDAIVQPVRGRAFRVAERLRDVYVHRVRRHAVR